MLWAHNLVAPVWPEAENPGRARAWISLRHCTETKVSSLWRDTLCTLSPLVSVSIAPRSSAYTKAYKAFSRDGRAWVHLHCKAKRPPWQGRPSPSPRLSASRTVGGKRAVSASLSFCRAKERTSSVPARCVYLSIKGREARLRKDYRSVMGKRLGRRALASGVSSHRRRAFPVCARRIPS
jgi:hypothetical protein